MAMTETTQDPNRAGRRRPFTTWVKKLTHFKGGASGGASGDANTKRHISQMKIAPKKRASKNNNPYPLSGRIGVINNPNRFADESSNPDTSGYYQPPHHHHAQDGSHRSFTSQSAVTSGSTSLGHSRRSSLIESASEDGRAPPTAGVRSMAPTVSTDHDVPRSMLAPSNGAASSITGTSRTIYGGPGSRRGGDSTFSSPAPSVRSLTTTLTTIQSLGPGVGGGGAPTNGALDGGVGGGGGGAPSIGGTSGAGITFSAVQPSHHNQQGHHHHGSQTIQFHQPFPSTPASAIPSHLTLLSGTAGPGHPATYSSATANNLLTDNASILTLASSSKRRRRRSLDTDASVRALAPSSLFGGSRESLPLSVLSATFEGSTLVPSSSVNNNVASGSSMPATPGLPLHTTTSRMSVASAGLANTSAATAAAAERTSIYSATGILGGDRNSFYARQSLGGGGAAVAGDGASIRSARSARSGLLGHGRSESITGSIGGSLTNPLASPLASPQETAAEEATSGLASVTIGATKPDQGNAGNTCFGETKEKDDEK